MVGNALCDALDALPLCIGSSSFLIFSISHHWGVFVTDLEAWLAQNEPHPLFPFLFFSNLSPGIPEKTEPFPKKICSRPSSWLCLNPNFQTEKLGNNNSTSTESNVEPCISSANTTIQSKEEYKYQSIHYILIFNSYNLIHVEHRLDKIQHG